MEEPFHVSPEPPERHSLAVRGRGLHRFGGEDLDPEPREVAAGGDRQLQRSPKSPVHLHEPGCPGAVVPKLHHRGAVPLHLAEQPLRAGLEARIQGHRAPQAASGARRPHVAQPLVREPGQRPSVVAHGENTLALTGDEGLNQGPVLALPTRPDRGFELRRGVRVRGTQVGEEPVAVPGAGEARLDHAGISQGRRRLSR